MCHVNLFAQIYTCDAQMKSVMRPITHHHFHTLKPVEQITPLTTKGSDTGEDMVFFLMRLPLRTFIFLIPVAGPVFIIQSAQFVY